MRIRLGLLLLLLFGLFIFGLLLKLLSPLFYVFKCLLFQLQVLLLVSLKLIINEVDDLQHVGDASDVIVLETLSLDYARDTPPHHQTCLVDVCGHI